ncbi:unnamed protein product [Durusdinium trenchii]|uniref:Uncharacterized protein n=1 Tax=Durusdinium trenchii TaxID=1381693 RepID=A0ABP0PLV5_9DINO
MVLRLLHFAILGLCLADEEASPGCQLLQMGVERRKGGNNGGQDRHIDPKETGICVSQLPIQDLSRPIRQVAETYGGDGWCVFGSVAPWLSNCAVSRLTQNTSTFVAEYDFLNEPQATPYTLKLFDDRSLTIRDHFYPLDDLYCFVNGWYSLDRAATVQNFTYLEEVSEESCKHLAEIVPGYHNLSMQDMFTEATSDQTFLWNLEQLGGGLVTEEVVNGMYLHAAAKCLLGGGHGALCDIANCASRGCLAEGKSELLYTARGECSRLTPRSGVDYRLGQ